MTRGILLSAVALTLLLGPHRVHGGSATWLFSAGSGDWNTVANWTPGGPPNGMADTATFQSSIVSALSISSDTQVGSITFALGGVTPYTIAAGPATLLMIGGSGITNNSGITQNFVAAGNNGTIQFTNSAAAGFNTAFTTNGGAASGPLFGTTEFRDAANAGNASFVTNGGTVSGAFGGVTQFFDSSSAGHGTFVTNGRTLADAGSGVTLFHDSSSAGNANVTTNGGGAPLALGGITQFLDRSTAGHGTFTINGGAVNGADGGLMQFFRSSTAGHGTFTTNGGAIRGEGGGQIEFHDSSSAGSGTFITQGTEANFGGFGQITFFDTSNAGSAAFTTNGGGNSGALGGGSIYFTDNSSASNGTFTTNGSTRTDGAGGIIQFRNNSSAGSGTFITNGSAFRSFVCPGDVCGIEHPSPAGSLLFFETSTAASATLIANGGIDGGDGGLILFGAGSSGGSARVAVFGNARVDISSQLDPALGLTIGSLEGTGIAALGSARLIVGSNDLSTTFSGIIQDEALQRTTGGSLTKVGTGTLILSGANTYTGNTTIDGGTLQVDGSVMSPETFVNSGGQLGGTGVIFGNVSNHSVVRPGHSPGTLSIGVNYTQFVDGTLRIEVAGRAPGQFDLLAIGGTASLSGALQVARLNNFTFRRGDRLAILTAAGGVNGVFNPVENPFAMSGTILEVMVVYEPNTVVLELVQGAFAGLPGLTPNEQAVASNLDLTVSDPHANALINFLDAEPLGNLPRDLDLITPEELTAIYETAFSQANVQSANVERRLSDIRAGSTGFSSAGYAIAAEKQFDPKGTTQSSVMDARPDNRWGVFVTGTGQVVNVDDDLNAAGYEITSGGMTLGIDYRVSKNFALGLYGGYAHGNAALVNDGSIDTNSGKFGGYATFHSGAFHVDGIVGGGLNRYETRRAALTGDARGATEGREFTSEIATGYDWTFAGIKFGPNASLRYTSVSFDGFTERGSLAPLQIDGDDEQNVRSALGVKLGRDFKIGRAILRPEIGAAWKHAFESDRSYDVNARLASGAGGVFTTRGPSLGRESALLDAGVSVEWTERCATYLFYDGEIGRNRYDSHALTGGARISF